MSESTDGRFNEMRAKMIQNRSFWTRGSSSVARALIPTAPAVGLIHSRKVKYHREIKQPSIKESRLKFRPGVLLLLYIIYKIYI